MKIRSAEMIVTIAILGALGVIGAFYVFNAFIYQQKQEPHEIDRYRATLTGEYLCLPHVNNSGPQTMECALGLRTDSGEYYALDFALMSQEATELMTGDRISANGLVTPIEMLSTDHWRQYPLEGIFSVTDSLQVLE